MNVALKMYKTIIKRALNAANTPSYLVSQSTMVVGIAKLKHLKFQWNIHLFYINTFCDKFGNSLWPGNASDIHTVLKTLKVVLKTLSSDTEFK